MSNSKTAFLAISAAYIKRDGTPSSMEFLTGETTNQKGEVYVGCEMLPYMLSGHFPAFKIEGSHDSFNLAKKACRQLWLETNGQAVETVATQATIAKPSQAKPSKSKRTKTLERLAACNVKFGANGEPNMNSLKAAGKRLGYDGPLLKPALVKFVSKAGKRVLKAGKQTSVETNVETSVETNVAHVDRLDALEASQEANATLLRAIAVASGIKL